ncbi:hypothetical protein J437_LFUL000612 [Ladona fulva]|uniref:Uncharacterized protein n=1 Tax=Ladona fulva TaxID=123851 RepID=A0A8K0K8H1_LADFU|nr:hypothetical protein J437_LFUL000612 [Ladona fulva]
MWNASRFCVSSLRRGHANLLCIVPILVYVPPKRQTQKMWNASRFCVSSLRRGHANLLCIVPILNIGSDTLEMEEDTIKQQRREESWIGRCLGPPIRRYSPNIN